MLRSRFRSHREPGGEHVDGSGSCEPVGEIIAEPPAGGGGWQQDQSGFGAELSAAQQHRCGQIGGDLGSAGRGRRGGDREAVEAAQFAVERDWVRPVDGEVEQRSAAADRPGKCGRPDGGVDHQCGAGVEPVDQGEGSLRCATVSQRQSHDLGDQFRGRRVPGVGFDDDGAAGRQRGRGVGAGHGEREREVACGEHGDRTHRDQGAAQIRSRRDRCIGIGMLDDGPQVGPVEQEVSEHCELIGGPGELRPQPRLAEFGFGVGGIDDHGGRPVEAGGDRPQRRRPVRSGCRRPRGCGQCSLCAAGVDVGVGHRGGHASLSRKSVTSAAKVSARSRGNQ